MPDGNLDSYEKQVARDRAALADSLETLSQTVAPERIKSDITETAETYARQLWKVTRDNPAAFALLGAGATLLATGFGQRTRQPETRKPKAVGPEEAMHGFDHRVAAANRAMNEQRSHSPMARAPSASRMRAALRSGLERLPPDARRRVLDARLSALRIQEKIERRAERAASRSAEMIREHPVEAGALAFGLGVLSAAVLPSSETEDAVLGEKRERLMQAARDAMQREIKGMRGTVQEVRTAASEASPNVPS
jgi:hypothetical protein